VARGIKFGYLDSVAVLPNIYTRKAVEGQVVALTDSGDQRVAAYISAHPMLGTFLSRFKAREPGHNKGKLLGGRRW